VKTAKTVTNEFAARVKGELKILRASMGVLALFLVSWSPIAVVLLGQLAPKIPAVVTLYLALLAHCNSTLNFLVYFVANGDFRKGLKDLVKKIFSKT